MRNIVLLALALVGSFVVVGCASSEPAGDYKEPEQGSYKSSEEVPERGGRTKAEAGGGGAGMGRSEGG